MIKLSERLAAVASFADGGKKIIDVGTDHGYIPVHFAEKGNALRIAASDINSEPLASAVRSAEEYGVRDKIEFFLSNGLENTGSDYDTVIIAGMGGETMVSILENAKWTLSQKTKLVLQPQTKTDELIPWLYKSGYTLHDARLVKDGGKLYVIFTASSDGDKAHSDAGLYAENILFENRDPLLPEYLDGLIKKFSIRVEGLRRAKDCKGQDLEKLELTLSGLIRLRGEA